MRLLVVEDEVKTGDYLRQGLAEAGFIVELARNGLDGHHLAMTETFELIVLDVMLPSMSGLEVCRTLKQSTDTVGTPVIMLTARSGEDDAQAGYDAGADRYLTKPFSPLTLLTEVVKLLDMELA